MNRFWKTFDCRLNEAIEALIATWETDPEVISYAPKFIGLYRAVFAVTKKGDCQFIILSEGMLGTTVEVRPANDEGGAAQIGCTGFE